MESGVLTELELRALRESSNKSLGEVAKALKLTTEETAKILESARRKLSLQETEGSIEITSNKDIVFPKPRFFRLEKKIGQPQEGTIKVGSQIIEVLGKGVYSAPWNSLKELISNSFDACATRVDIHYFSGDRRMVLRDDGLGMNYVDFDNHFTFITQSDKRKSGDISIECGRPLIGKFGIGFVAVSQLCDKIRVTSAKRGGDTYFVAMLDFGKLRREEAADKEFYQVSQYVLTNYEKIDLNEHYTEIELLELNKPFVNVLENVVPSGSPCVHLEAESFEDVVLQLCSGRISSIRREAGPLWEFLIHLANVIPIEYLGDGPISFSDQIVISSKHRKAYDETMEIINGIRSRVKKFNFRVFYNGLQLKKAIRFPNEDWLTDYNEQLRVFPIKNNLEVVDPSTNRTIEVSYKGYMYYQKTRIVPEEFRGLTVRIRNVAIGGPSLDLWGYPYPGDKLYLDQVFGEIYVDSGLEDAMNIDRSTFKTTHFEYAAMRDSLHQFLHQVVFAAAKEMWFSRRASKALEEGQQTLRSRVLAVRETLGFDFGILETRKYNQKPVEIRLEEKRLYLNPSSPVFVEFKKDDRILLQDVAISLEIAMKQEKDPEKMKAVFWEILRLLTRYR